MSLSEPTRAHVWSQVGDVKHNKELSVLAQRWADHLAATSVLKHSNDTYRGDQVGENVASKWSSAGADYTGADFARKTCCPRLIFYMSLHSTSVQRLVPAKY